MNKPRREHGYTLIETIVVLLIFSILLLIPALYFPDYGEARKFDAFLTEYKQDLHFAQQHAMATNQAVAVRVNNNYGYYQVTQHGEELKRVPFPDDVRFRSATIPSTSVTFSANGNTVRAGTFHIEGVGRLYRVTFLVGTGRFYFAEI